MRREFDQAAEEAAIRQNILDGIPAWDKGDANAYAARYTPDADQIIVGRRTSTGRTEIERAVGEELSGPYRGTTLTIDRISIRFLGPDTAIVDLRGQLAGVQSGAAPTLPLEGVIVSVKHEGKWAIAGHRVWSAGQYL
jgi:uncharacterized protein (TIGR02246 family)